MSNLADKFYKILTTAQDKRRWKSGWVEGPEGLTLEWILYERETMFKAVNWERAVRDLQPVTMEQLRRVEDSATGHCDYTRKFALYSAELVDAR